MEILFKNSDSEKNLSIYSELYFKCFKEDKFKLNYLEWLYNKNPDGGFVGIDCFDNENLIGQAGGIPHEFIFNQKKVRFLISLNVCVIPQYRGNQIFSKMLNRLENRAKELKFDGIIAIANKSAYPGWLRSIKMKKLKALDVYVGFQRFNIKNITKSNYDFYTYWTKKKLEWRIKNPLNPTYIKSNNNEYSIYSKTKFMFINAYSPLIFFDKEMELYSNNKRQYKPFVYLGSISKIKKPKLLCNLPESLKPSPLNFVYKFFKSDETLDSKNIIFTYLEFDVF